MGGGAHRDVNTLIRNRTRSYVHKVSSMKGILLNRNENNAHGGTNNTRKDYYRARSARVGPPVRCAADVTRLLRRGERGASAREARALPAIVQRLLHPVIIGFICIKVGLHCRPTRCGSGEVGRRRLVNGDEVRDELDVVGEE